MKRIFLLSTLLCASLFLTAQTESYLQRFLNQEENVLISSITDCESLLDSTVFLKIYDDGPDYDRRIILEYDDQNREILKTTEDRSWVDEIFRLDIVDETEYIGNEKVRYRAIYDDVLEELVPDKRQTTILGTNDLAESYVIENYNPDTETYEPLSKSTYSYYPDNNFLQEKITENWNESLNTYVPIRRQYNYYDEVEDTLIDSLVVQGYDVFTGALIPGISYHFAYSADNDIAELSIYRAYNPGDELSLFLKDSLVHAPNSDNYFVYEMRGESSANSILELEAIRHVNRTGNLIYSDSTFTKNDDTGEFLLDEIKYYDYDDEGRRILLVIQEEDANGNFVLVDQRTDHYQACETSSTEIMTNQIDCLIPNPIYNGQSISCILEDQKNCKLKLYNFFGQQIFESKIQTSESIRLDNLPINGVYFVTIDNGKQILMRRKVIVAN